MSKSSVQCPECKGKGYKFDPVSLCMGPFLLVAWMIEKHDHPLRDRTCTTKEVCQRCNGSGYIWVN